MSQEYQRAMSEQLPYLLYVRDSNDFRSFEDDLISAERWENQVAVLREIGTPILLAPIQKTLAGFRKELEAKFWS